MNDRPIKKSGLKHGQTAESCIGTQGAYRDTDTMRFQASDLLSSKQVSQLLNTSEEELEKWRSSGTGPRYFRTAPNHRSVKYSLEAVMCFLKEERNEEKLF